ncbi:MAG: hypothetical protein ABTQ32_19900 [Myxococcaceae bacterium]
MRLIALALLVSTAAWADDWWGTDKALHLSVSVGLGAAGYSVGAVITENEFGRVAAGALGAVAIGVLKECADGLGLGQPSMKDLTWDLIGSITGALLGWVVDRIVVTPLLESFAPRFAG